VFGENSPLVDVLKLAGVLSPALTKPLVNSYSNNKWTRHLPLGISSVVSNVAGPTFPLYSAGAQMVRYYGLGLLTPGVGLFHLIFSSNGIMTMSILGDRDAMPDPAFYRECIEKSFTELLSAAKSSQAETKKQPAVAKKAVKSAANSVAKTPTRAQGASAASTAKKTATKRSAKSSLTTPVKKPIVKKAKSAAAAKSASSKAQNEDDGNVVPIKVSN